MGLTKPLVSISCFRAMTQESPTNITLSVYAPNGKIINHESPPRISKRLNEGNSLKISDEDYSKLNSMTHRCATRFQSNWLGRQVMKIDENSCCDGYFRCPDKLMGLVLTVKKVSLSDKEDSFEEVILEDMEGTIHALCNETTSPYDGSRFYGWIDIDDVCIFNKFWWPSRLEYKKEYLIDIIMKQITEEKNSCIQRIYKQASEMRYYFDNNPKLNSVEKFQLMKHLMWCPDSRMHVEVVEPKLCREFNKMKIVGEVLSV